MRFDFVDWLIGGKYGFIDFFDATLVKWAVFERFDEISLTLIIFLFFEDYLRRLIVELKIFSLGFVWM